MDKFIGIFQKLGVDGSIFYQFAIFVVLFFLLKVVFFNKLLFVLQTRESKTTKLDEEAGEKFKEAENLSKKFDEEIQKTNEEIHLRMSDLKSKSLSDISKSQKEKETEVLSEYENNKNAVIAEVESMKSGVLQQAGDLSEGLVQKLIN